MFYVHITDNKTISWETYLVLPLLLINSTTIATYWRLGAYESLFTLLLMIGILCYRLKRYYLFIISIVLLALLKEISIFVFLVSGFVLLFEKKIKLVLLTFGLCIIYYLILIKCITSIALFNPSAYELQYVFSGSAFISNVRGLMDRTPILFVLLAFNIILVGIHIFRHQNQAKFLVVYLFLLSASLLAPYLFLIRQETCYLFPSLVCSILCFTFGLQTLPIQKKFLKISICACVFIYFLFTQPIQFVKEMQMMKRSYYENELLISFTQQNPQYEYRFQDVNMNRVSDWINDRNHAYDHRLPTATITINPFLDKPNILWSLTLD